MSYDDHRHIRHHAKYYLILNDTLYHRGIDSILQQCLTHKEVERVLNDFHSGACGGHLFGMEKLRKSFALGIFGPQYS